MNAFNSFRAMAWLTLVDEDTKRALRPADLLSRAADWHTQTPFDVLGKFACGGTVQ